MRGLSKWCFLWLALVAPSPARAHELELQLKSHVGGGAFAGRGWGANRPGEAFAATVSLRMAGWVSLDVRFLAQRLRYRSIAEVESDGWTYVSLFGAHVYPLGNRYRVQPRIGAFAGQLVTRARSSMAGPAVRLDVLAWAVGPSLGAQVTLGRRYGVGIDAQLLRSFEQEACMSAGARTVSCDALDHTTSYLATVLFSFAVMLW